MDSRAHAFIELFPLYFRSEAFKFRATAHASQRSLLLTADEVQALKILIREKSTRRTLAYLHTQNQRLEVDLWDLIERLKQARLVSCVNGERLEKPYALRWVVLRSKVRRFAGSLGPRFFKALMQMVGSVLPIRWLVGFGRAKYQWFYPKRKRAMIIEAVATNMSGVLPNTTPAQRQVLAEKNFLTTEVEKNLDLIVLMQVPHKRIGPWALKRVPDLDLTHLRKALAKGKGALVFHFHSGPIQMMSVILTALGYRVTVLGANIPRARETDMLMRIVDDLGPLGVRQLMGALERGEIVMISPDPDVHPIGARKDNEVGFRQRFANSWQRSSQVKTKLLGYDVEAYQGIAWLHAELGTPLLFAEIRNLAKRTLGFRIEPFETPARQQQKKGVWRQQIMDRMFQLYEQHLLKHPDQWDHWLSFFRYVNLKPLAQEPWMVLAKNGSDLTVTMDAPVQVGRYVVQPFKENNSLIVRMGTQSVMLTNPLGLAAMKHLRKGMSPKALAEKLVEEGFSIDQPQQIISFLKSLKAAGLLARVNGRKVRRAHVSKRRWLLHMFKLRGYPALFRLVDRRLGLGLRQRLLPAMEWLMEGRFKYAAQRYHLRNNFLLLLPKATPVQLDKAVKAFFREEVHADLSFQFTKRNIDTVFKWLDRYLDKEMPGFQALARCKQNKQGAIVASYHFGLFWLLPALLWKLGFRVHALVGSVLQSEDDLAGERKDDAPTKGLQFYDTNIANISKLPKFLEQGDLVVIYADALGRFAPDVNQAVHKTWGKSGRTKKGVSLLGYEFPLQPGVGWLHRNTGAPVFPAVLMRHGPSGKVRLCVEHPIEAHDSAPNRLGISALSADEVHEAVFYQLGKWITANPEQWRNAVSFPNLPMKRMKH